MGKEKDVPRLRRRRGHGCASGGGAWSQGTSARSEGLLNSPSRPQDTPKNVREGSPMIRFALWEIPTTETGSGEASLGTWYRRWRR